MDKNSLSHTNWNCKYHLIFAPKFRRQAIYGKLKQDVGKILRDLCERKGIEIIEAECCKDHVHMLVQIPPKYSVADLKNKYGNRHFWCGNWKISAVGKPLRCANRRMLVKAPYRGRANHRLSRWC